MNQLTGRHWPSQAEAKGMLGAMATALMEAARELPDAYDLAYDPTKASNTTERVSGSKASPGLQGNAKARAVLLAIDDLATACYVRCCYVMHIRGWGGWEYPASDASGRGLGPTRLKLQRCASMLNAMKLATHIPPDAMIQVVGKYQTPNIAEAVQGITAAMRRIFPKPTAAELPKLDGLCFVCELRPCMQGRKRCVTCQSYVGRTGRERPTYLDKNKKQAARPSQGAE